MASQGSTSSGGPGAAPTSHLESVIARLLVATKGLLDGLLKWSQGQVSEEAISTIYVKLGNDFNSAVAAFAKENIGMSELISIPVQLRACLEACLSEEPTPATFEKHLPRVRAIIINLLTGLREKQKLYRESVAARRAKEVARRERENEERRLPPAQALPPAPITPNSAQSSRENLRRFVQQAQSISTQPSARNSGSVVQSTRPSSGSSLASNAQARSQQSVSAARVPVPSERVPSRTGGRDDEASQQRVAPPARDAAPQASTSTASSAAQIMRPHSVESSNSSEDIVPPAESAARMQSLEKLKKSDSLSRRASKRFSAYAIHRITTGGTSPGRPGPMDSSFSSASPGKSPVWSDSSSLGPSPSAAGRELAQASADEHLRSLRRAKSEHRSSRVWDGSRSDIPPIPPIPASFANQDSRVPPSPILEEDAAATAPVTPQGTPGTEVSTSDAESAFSTAPALSRQASSTSSNGPSDIASTVARPESKASENGTSPNNASQKLREFPMTIYLQVGRNVRKARLDEPPTISSLRMLFLERFQYNPGNTDFPMICVRDARVGIQYELEDLSEIHDGTVLCLDVDDVEQVKNHIDAGLLSLAQELKELRTTVATMRRASVSAAPSTFDFASAASQRPNRSITDSPPPKRPPRHARTPSAALKDSTDSDGREAPSSPLAKSNASSAPTTRPSSTEPITAAVPSKVISTLKAQRDQVVALRQEIGVVRQVYSDFVAQTRSALLDLKTQTGRVQALAATKVSSSRAFIEAGKSKLENESSELVVRGDDLQDAIDQMRSDIMNRKIRPRPAQLAEVASTLRSVNEAREDLVKWLSSVKQSWKSTWEEELQTICAEQQMVDSHEKLLHELEDDLSEASSVLKAIQQVADSFKHAKGRNYVPPPVADDHQGLTTVMLEVKGLQPDPSKRLEAIERAEKARLSELANRKDDFADELDGFVSGQKLKKTGGVEETERVRQVRNEATLKAMFSG